jgi:signal transduction histidine kinase
VQESLSNAIRHGRPDRIEVELEPARDGALQVRVRDAGPQQGGGGAAGEGGFGLLGMQERVTQAGGALTVDQAAGGWTVQATLPVRPAGRARRRRARA